MSHKPFCATDITFSSKDELEQKILSCNVANIILVMSESSAIRWNLLSFIDKLRVKCKSLNGSLIWINSIAANPSQRDIVESLLKIGDKKADLIIAIGGGSSIDLAKGISAFYNTKKNDLYSINDITESIRNKEYKENQFVDIIAVPSTAGTGSEITQWATIWDIKGFNKLSIDDIMLKPKSAIIVPELTLSMPALMTLSTGLDAMCQAIESFWSKHTTPIVQEIAYRAVELGIKNLRKAIEEPNNIIVREALCKASVLAGLAFSQTRTTACHSISYPLTMFFGVPHGLAASITLDAVGKFNKGYFPNDSDIFDLFNTYGSIMEWIDMVSEGIIKLRLSVFNIREKDIPLIVDNAFTSGRMDNNPVNLSREDVTAILKSVM